MIFPIILTSNPQLMISRLKIILREHMHPKVDKKNHQIEKENTCFSMSLYSTLFNQMMH